MLLDYTYPQPSCGAVIKRCHFLPHSLPSSHSLYHSVWGQFWVWATLFSVLYSLFSVLCCALCVSIVWQLALFPLNWNCALASTLITIFVRPMLNFKLKTLIRIILVVVVVVVWLRLHCQCAAKVRHLNELWAHLWSPPGDVARVGWGYIPKVDAKLCLRNLTRVQHTWAPLLECGTMVEKRQEKGEGAQWDTRLVASAVLIS